MSIDHRDRQGLEVSPLDHVTPLRAERALARSTIFGGAMIYSRESTRMGFWSGRLGDWDLIGKIYIYGGVDTRATPQFFH